MLAICSRVSDIALCGCYIDGSAYWQLEFHCPWFVWLYAFSVLEITLKATALMCAIEVPAVAENVEITLNIAVYPYTRIPVYPVGSKNYTKACFPKSDLTHTQDHAEFRANF